MGEFKMYTCMSLSSVRMIMSPIPMTERADRAHGTNGICSQPDNELQGEREGVWPITGRD